MSFWDCVLGDRNFTGGHKFMKVEELYYTSFYKNICAKVHACVMKWTIMSYFSTKRLH